MKHKIPGICTFVSDNGSPKVGVWLFHDEYVFGVRCSKCEEAACYVTKYCPSCGARMLNWSESKVYQEARIKAVAAEAQEGGSDE